MKNLKKSLISVLLIAVFAVTACLFGCNNQSGDEWNVSADGANVKAYFLSDGNYGYILNVSGSGKMKDFSDKKQAPWYGKSQRISEIRILNGVTQIGANAFSNVSVSYAVIPASVKTVGQNAFNQNTELFVYGDVAVYEGATVFKYSETMPSTNGFWHFVDGKPQKWLITDQTVNKVLFIGNSFTFYSDIPVLFGSLASGAVKNITVESVTQGAYTLSKFADKTDEYGKIVDGKLNASNDYDVIILQDQSARPINNNSGFISGVKAMVEKINATQTNCRIYLYSTWGYQEAADSLKITIPEMELQLRNAYVEAASQVNAGVCFVGKAFTKVYTEHPEINLYYSDNKHPSYNGAFLSACVHVATILNIDPRTSAFTGDQSQISAETVNLLKQAAYTVVFG